MSLFMLAVKVQSLLSSVVFRRELTLKLQNTDNHRTRGAALQVQRKS